MKLKLKESDFEEYWISFAVPKGVFDKLHFHPCEMEVDLSELQDNHNATAKADESPAIPQQQQDEICANDPCAYCFYFDGECPERCNMCDHNDMFVGRKLSPVR